ncbi:unnamed protein product [Phytomonas sp. EM1]|nr:unnamed protein product [Phytomonas sp. EM1]|eukprot:CCW62022.1 unnamed protein product [Phytomonas sp. isolate EM1]
MQNRISKDNFAEIAQHAVTSIRRLVSSGHQENTRPSQQDLLSASKQIEEMWKKNKMPVDVSVVNLWVTSLAAELYFHLNSEDKGSARRFISESVMVTTLEAARIVCHTDSLSNCTPIVIRNLILLLVEYFMKIPLTKRVRDILALVLVELYVSQVALLDELVEVIIPFLVVQSTTTSESDEVTEKSNGEIVDQPRNFNKAEVISTICPIQIYLASLLVTALHRISTLGFDSTIVESMFKRRMKNIIALLQSAYNVRCTASLLTDDTGDAPSSSSSTYSVNGYYQVAVCVVYLSLIGGLFRGNDACKRLVTSGYGHEFSTVWTFTASRLSHMKLELIVPAPTPKDSVVTLDAVQVWQSELLELVIELCSEDSFSLRRMTLSESLDSERLCGAGSPRGNDAVGSSHITGMTPKGVGAGFQVTGQCHYNPIPLCWDTILAGGSRWVWKLASSVSCCLFTSRGTDVLELCLLGLETSNALAESMLRCFIFTMALMCFANPYNAKRLAERQMFECLFAVATNRQDSIFMNTVRMNVSKGGQVSDGIDNCTVVSPAPTEPTANTIQLVVSFMCSLASLCFPKRILHLLMEGVKDMSRVPFCQTDILIEESLLYVLSHTYVPPCVLFFPGNGSIRCKLSQFVGRWSGYSFSAWIHPLCVWTEGCHLFSYTLSSGTSVAISVVANGRSCFLAVRVNTLKESTVTLVPESTFYAETWSHIALTHGLSAMFFYVNGRKLNTGFSVPFPKDHFERHKLDLAFGGATEDPSFFGYVTSMNLLEGAISEKDIMKLYAQGPSTIEGSEFRVLLSVGATTPFDRSNSERIFTSITDSTVESCAHIKGSLSSKCDSISVYSVYSVMTCSVQEEIQDCDILPWALQTLKESHESPNFFAIAKLCLEFVSVAMRTTNTDAELNAILKDSYLAELNSEILTWSDTFSDFPAILLLGATLRGSCRTLRPHQSTQAIFSILMERLEVVCRAKEGDYIVRNPSSVAIILRELSDYLSDSENVKLFKEVSRRFKRILFMSLDLPPECIEAVVVLIEKLCKGVPELEHTLRFLLLPQPFCPNADATKAGILRMLFDVARTNVMMCDWIGSCFKGRGASFLIMLVHGKNHSSEAIRIFSLRLLSLMLHVNRKFRETFIKSNKFEVISCAITDQTSTVPIRLPTLDCLFHMAFDEYLPTESSNENIVSCFNSNNLRTRTSSGVGVENSVNLLNGVQKSLNLTGHSPGLFSRRLKVTHREYSFDVAHDFGKSAFSLQFADSYCSKSTPNTSLCMPQAFKAALQVLGCLITTIGNTFHTSRTSGSENDSIDASGATVQEGTLSPTFLASSYGDEVSERVVVRVLHYLEKIIDINQNGVALLLCPWLEWFWNAISPVISYRRSHSEGSPLGANANAYWTKKFPSTVITHARYIIRKLLVLDITRNSKAAMLRRIRESGTQFPYLIRIILEEVLRHFSKCGLSDPDHASNVIKNINYLLLNVEHMLDPFPIALGVEIVVSISAIAIRNNSWVRMRMKNSTQLFDTRDRLAFYLLATSKHYFKVDIELLVQLIDANAHNPNSMCLLLQRFTRAINQKDVDELEIILQMIRHLVIKYEDQHWEVYKLLGTTCTRLAELLCMAAENDGSSPRPQAVHPKLDHMGSPQPCDANTRSRTDAAMNYPPLGPGAHRDPKYNEPIGNDLPVMQIIEWCRTHEVEWISLTQQLEQKVAKIMDILLKSSRDRCEKEKALVLKASRAQKERRERAKSNALEELKSIRNEVEAELSV